MQITSLLSMALAAASIVSAAPQTAPRNKAPGTLSVSDCLSCWDGCDRRMSVLKNAADYVGVSLSQESSMETMVTDELCIWC